MNDTDMSPLERILRACAEAAPNPWYPSLYARTQGVNRDELDPYLDQLRLGGLVRLTDWVQGQGQGYALTEMGQETLNNPRRLAKLQQGKLPAPNGQPVRSQARAQNVATPWERGEAARNAFFDSSMPWVTRVLVALNVLWFLAELAVANQQGIPAESSRVLLETGALNAGYFYGLHQWWRLFTNAFVHIGMMHIAVNMISLYWIGPFLERVWGHARFLILYVVAIIGGSCGVLVEAMVNRHDVVAAGASGAIWGILASLGTWLFLNRRALPPAIVTSMTQALVINLLLNVGITFGVSNISKGAHFGGGIAGLLVAIPLDYVAFVRGFRRALAIAGVLAVPVLSLSIAFGIPYSRPGGWFQRENVAEDFNEFGVEFGGSLAKATSQAENAYAVAVKELQQRQINSRDAASTQRKIDAARKQLAGTLGQLGHAQPHTTQVAEFVSLTRAYLQEYDAVLALCDQAIPLATHSPDDQAAVDQEKKLSEQIDVQTQSLDRTEQQWGRVFAQLKQAKE